MGALPPNPHLRANRIRFAIIPAASGLRAAG